MSYQAPCRCSSALGLPGVPGRNHQPGTFPSSLAHYQNFLFGSTGCRQLSMLVLQSTSVQPLGIVESFRPEKPPPGTPGCTVSNPQILYILAKILSQLAFRSASRCYRYRTSLLSKLLSRIVLLAPSRTPKKRELQQ